MTSRSGRWARPVLLLLAVGLGAAAWAPAAFGQGGVPVGGTTGGTQAPPTLQLVLDRVGAGDRLTALLHGWPIGTVRVEVCGNRALRGSVDCDVTRAAAVAVGPSSAANATVAATAPVACPCVVRATALTGATAIAPVEIAGLDAPAVPSLDRSAPSVPPAGVLTVRARVDTAGTGPALGQPQRVRLLLSLRNDSSATVRDLRATIAVGRSVASGSPVPPPDLDPLAPGEERTYALPVDVAGPALGTFAVFGEIHGLTAPVPFTASFDLPAPVGTIVVVGAALPVVIALGRRRRQRRRFLIAALDGAVVPAGDHAGDHAGTDPTPPPAPTPVLVESS